MEAEITVPFLADLLKALYIVAACSYLGIGYAIWTLRDRIITAPVAQLFAVLFVMRAFAIFVGLLISSYPDLCTVFAVIQLVSAGMAFTSAYVLISMLVTLYPKKDME